MPRTHKVTHPHLGAASWKEIEAARAEVSKSRGFRVCSWCWQQVPKGARTRCGKKECDEKLWQAQQWGRCAALVLRRDRICVICKSRGSTECDHVVPVSLGGTGDLTNLRGLCEACHKSETARLRKLKDKFVAAA